MTCIAGIRIEGKGVLLGADSLGSDGDRGSVFKNRKAFRLSRDVAIGYCGSFRLGQLLEHHLDQPVVHGDERTWAVKTLVPEVRNVLKDAGFVPDEEGGNRWLLAVRDRLFIVENELAVLEPNECYTAIGSGQDFALGAMHALPRANPRQRVKAGLAAAAAYGLGVGQPFTFAESRV